MITGMVQDIYEGIKTIENSRAFGSCQNHFSTCSFKNPALQGTCQGRPLQRGFFKRARREKILTRAERLRHFGHFGAFWLMGIAIQVRNGRQKVRSLGYYKNFFVLGVIANLRPLFYTNTPHLYKKSGLGYALTQSKKKFLQQPGRRGIIKTFLCLELQQI